MKNLNELFEDNVKLKQQQFLTDFWNLLKIELKKIGLEGIGNTVKNKNKYDIQTAVYFDIDGLLKIKTHKFTNKGGCIEQYIETIEMNKKGIVKSCFDEIYKSIADMYKKIIKENNYEIR